MVPSLNVKNWFSTAQSIKGDIFSFQALTDSVTEKPKTWLFIASMFLLYVQNKAQRKLPNVSVSNVWFEFWCYPKILETNNWIESESKSVSLVNF